MAESNPTHGLELLEWIKVIFATIATAIGSVWAWWKGTKHAIYHKIDHVEKAMNSSMDTMRHAHNLHHTKIAVLETQQQNSHQQLQSIHEDTKDIREKVDQLVRDVMNRK